MHPRDVCRVEFSSKLAEIELIVTPSYVKGLETIWFAVWFGSPFVIMMAAQSLEASLWRTFVVIFLVFVFTARIGEKYFRGKRYLPVSAREFYATNKAEIQDLNKRVGNFNSALAAIQGSASQPSPEDTRNESLAAYLEEHRRIFQEKLDE